MDVTINALVNLIKMKMIRKFLLPILAITLFACNNVSIEPTITPFDQISISGIIKNAINDSLFIVKDGSDDVLSTILLNSNGTFIDTLNLDKGMYEAGIGDEHFYLYLNKGFSIYLKMNYDEFDESLRFNGVGAQENNSIATCILKNESILHDLLGNRKLDSISLSNRLQNYEEEMTKILANSQIDDSLIIAQQEEAFQTNIIIIKQESSNHKLITKLIGQKSPSFNYKSSTGKHVSLEDFKANYVYIDVWATWCGPCIQEIPYLETIQEKYHDKNIKFISISIDDQKNMKDWLLMVSDMELKGIQVIADNAFYSEFIRGYYIQGIPRFILLDKEGKIINPNAPRPSNTELVEILNELPM